MSYSWECNDRTFYIVSEADLWTLYCEEEKIITSSSPKSLIGLMNSGSLDDDIDWEFGRPPVPPIEEWNED